MRPILTARLRLRPLARADLDALTGIYQHPGVARWIGPHTREDVEEEIALQMTCQATRGWSFWAVEDRRTGRLIGDCGLQPLEHRGPEIELGYDFHPEVWGRGVATEAAQAVMRHARQAAGIERVVAVVKPDHRASQRVLLKAGLHRTGTRLAYGEPMLFYETAPPSRGSTAASVASSSDAASSSSLAPGPPHDGRADRAPDARHGQGDRRGGGPRGLSRR